MNHRKILYWLIGLLIYWIIPLTPVQAAGEFQADYDVSYSVAPTGSTIVSQRVTLTNKETSLYPRQYAVVIGTEKISDVIARDDAGVITPEIKQEDGKTKILLTFNQKVVGLGRQLTFTLRFQNQDIATHNGNIWEINIPSVAPDPDLGSYSVTLDVPPSFGPNAYLSPLPENGRRWTKEQMLRGGVSAAFGTKQTFLVNASYFLENTKVNPVTTEIALPPDTAFQKVAILSLVPRPTTVTRDSDGNWLAHYALLPATRINVLAKLLVEIRLSEKPDQKDTLTDPNTYTQPLTYWETSDPKIKELAVKYNTPRSIYNYVVNALKYDKERVRQSPVRKGALQALAAPDKSVCMEFTDLFIAIARAAGIPAREAVGFAYTTDPDLRPLSLVNDVLHSWPEYYDGQRQLWIPVDPTWGNTTGGVNYFDKLDFNHIVFAIHGLSSTYPYPAGFYRENGKNSKDVNVQFTDQKIEPTLPKLTVDFDFPKTITAGFLTSGSVTVTNTTGIAVDSLDVAIKVSPFAFSLTRKDYLPPFGRLTYPVNFMVNGFFTNASGNISTNVNGQMQNFYFSVRPFYWLLVPITGFATGGLLILSFILVTLRLWKRRKRS